MEKNREEMKIIIRDIKDFSKNILERGESILQFTIERYDT